MTHEELEDKYLDTTQKVEELWEETKRQGFPQRLSDELYTLANQARLEYFKVILSYEISGEPYRFVKSIPGYIRAIMLLEHEKRIKQALYLSLQYKHEAERMEHALDKIKTDWVDKKIQKFLEELSPEDQETVLRKQYENEKREWETKQGMKQQIRTVDSESTITVEPKGVTEKNPNGIKRQQIIPTLEIGETIFLKPAGWDDPRLENSGMVFLEAKNRGFIGYVDGELGKQITEDYEKGQYIMAKVKELKGTGKRKDPYWCIIEMRYIDMSQYT